MNILTSNSVVEGFIAGSFLGWWNNNSVIVSGVTTAIASIGAKIINKKLEELFQNEPPQTKGERLLLKGSGHLLTFTIYMVALVIFGNIFLTPTVFSYYFNDLLIYQSLNGFLYAAVGLGEAFKEMFFRENRPLRN